MATVPASCTRHRPTAWMTSNSCVANGLKYDDILNPVQGNGTYAEPTCPLFGGLHIWKACARVILECWAQGGWPLDGHRGHYPQLPTLLAPQDTGDLPRCRPVVYPHGRRSKACSPKTRPPRPCANSRLDAIEAHQLLPREWPRPFARHDCQPAQTGASARQRSWGVPDSLLPAQGQRRAAPATPWKSLTKPPISSSKAASKPGAA